MRTTFRRWLADTRGAPVPVARWVRRSPSYVTVGLPLVAVVVGGAALATTSWDWLSTSEFNGIQMGESGSTTLRNVGLLAAAPIALIVAVWRSRVAERQADTAQRGLLNERYQQGAAMLGSDVLAVRLAGIYALQRLAEEHPVEYHIEATRLLCAFVRHPGGEEVASSTSGHDPSGPRADVQAAMEVICASHGSRWAFEYAEGFELNLVHAVLARTRLEFVDLSSAELTGADLFEARLREADLTHAQLAHTNLNRADLTRARLPHADLHDADLTNAILSGTLFSEDAETPVYGLTQAQLDSARADPDDPPVVDGVLDAGTGDQLVWRGRPPLPRIS